MDPSCLAVVFSSSGGGEFWLLMQSGLLFVAALLSVPGLRHVAAQDLAIIMVT